MATTNEMLRSEARQWARCGVMPCEAKVRDWGCQGCHRWVVVVTFCARFGQDDLYCGEYDSRREAAAAGKRFEKVLDEEYAAARAAIEAAATVKVPA